MREEEDKRGIKRMACGYDHTVGVLIGESGRRNCTIIEPSKGKLVRVKCFKSTEKLI